MFRPNCRAIFRLIFEQVEYTIDYGFNLRDLVLQELVKIITVYYIKNLRLNSNVVLYIINIKNRYPHPHNHPVNFTLSVFHVFNAYCIKYHIEFTFKFFFI